jgi:hypothetical protein
MSKQFTYIVPPCPYQLQEKNVNDWQDYMDALLGGTLNPDIEITVQEAVGNAPVTLSDLKYACAIVRTTSTAAHRFCCAACLKRVL